MRLFADAQLFLFCTNCDRLTPDNGKTVPCRCHSIFIDPIFVWVESK